jgi:hypothetical protein
MSNCVLYIYHDSDDPENVKPHNKVLLDYIDSNLRRINLAGYVFNIKLIRDKKDLVALQKKGINKLPALKMGKTLIVTSTKIIKKLDSFQSDDTLDVNETYQYQMDILRQPDDDHPDDINNSSISKRMAAYDAERRARDARYHGGQDAKSIANKIRNDVGNETEDILNEIDQEQASERINKSTTAQAFKAIRSRNSEANAEDKLLSKFMQNQTETPL